MKRIKRLISFFYRFCVVEAWFVEGDEEVSLRVICFDEQDARRLMVLLGDDEYVMEVVVYDGNGKRIGEIS